MKEITINHDFGERNTENGLPVWQTPKYKQSRAKAIEIINKYDNIQDGDFWILMNKTKDQTKMLYTGLIISHNACLKLNDQSDEKFKPSCVTLDKDGFNESLVYTYCNDDQGIFEVGEVSKANCNNAYPYAMAYKRLFDRVVLKLNKLAFDGVYSDSEADEFKEHILVPTIDDMNQPAKDEQLEEINRLALEAGFTVFDVAELWRKEYISELTVAQAYKTIENWPRFIEKLTEGQET